MNPVLDAILGMLGKLAESELATVGQKVDEILELKEPPGLVPPAPPGPRKTHGQLMNFAQAGFARREAARAARAGLSRSEA